MYRPRAQNQPLPVGWEAKFDSNTNRWFFLNHVTRKTQWEDPRLTMQQPSPAQQPRQQNYPQQTTSFVEPSASSVKALKNQYNVDEELVKSLLRTHVNRVNIVEEKLKEMGYKKKVQVDQRHLMYLAQQYPMADKETIRQCLAETNNNVQGARLSLEVMGFKKFDPDKPFTQSSAAPKPSFSSAKSDADRRREAHLLAEKKAQLKAKTKELAKKKELSHAEKMRIKREMKAKYPNIDEDTIGLCLGSTNYDVIMTSNILENQLKNEERQKKAEERRRREEEEENERRRHEEEERRAKANQNFSPVVFGSENEPTPSPSVAQPYSLPKTTPSKPKPAMQKIIPQKTLFREKENLKPTMVKDIPKKDIVEKYKSTLRIQPTGHNPAICKGPNPNLLVKSLSTKMGPNKENQKGPQESNYVGPLLQNRAGPMGISYRSV